MSLTVRVLIGLVLGLVSGIAISLSSIEALTSLPSLVEPIGTLWVNSIRMTVVPLIISLLVTAIASDHDSGLVAKLGGKTIGLFVAMVAVGCVFVAVTAPPLLALLHFDSATTEALRATSSTAATSGAVKLPPFRDWFVNVIPANPLKAAVDGTMLPLVVFIGLFALAMVRISDTNRETLLRFFGAIKDTMFVLIGWVMAMAPIGVFALMLPLAATMGSSAAGAFGYYLLISFGLTVIALVFLYLLVLFFSRIPIAKFARACVPAQVVAFSTKSSLASLPAMYTTSETLRISSQISGLVLPLAVSLFKFASPIGRASGTYFIAQLYGIDLGPVEIIAIAGATGLLSFYTPGIPSGGLLIMTPLYVSLNLPVEGIGILIALDLIVDMFLTPANVTANLAVVALLSRGKKRLADDLMSGKILRSLVVD